MRCIVTGAAGFIGSHLVDALLAEGHSVLGIDDLSTGRTKNLAAASANSAFQFLEKNIRDLSKGDLALESCDWFFHLAGRADLVPSIVNPEDYFQVNVEGTFRALQLARELGVKRFLYAASSTCYGIPDTYPTPESTPCKPEHPYALTKLMGEEMVMHWHRVYQLPAVSLRLFNVYGPRSRTTGAYGAVFGVFLRQKLAGVPFTVVGDGSQTRSFCYVDDLVEGIVRLLHSDCPDPVNIGNPDEITIGQFAEEIIKLTGTDQKVIYKDLPIDDPKQRQPDITKAKALLGWEPQIDRAEGLKRTYAYFKSLSSDELRQTDHANFDKYQIK